MCEWYFLPRITLIHLFRDKIRFRAKTVTVPRRYHFTPLPPLTVTVLPRYHLSSLSFHSVTVSNRYFASLLHSLNDTPPINCCLPLPLPFCHCKFSSPLHLLAVTVSYRKSVTVSIRYPPSLLHSLTVPLPDPLNVN